MCPNLRDLTFTLEELHKSINYEWLKRHHINEDIDIPYFINYSRDLGRGQFSVVRKAIERDSGKRFAVKSVKKSDTAKVDALKQEACSLARLDHPYIVKFHSSYEDKRNFYMVTDLCKGGDVFEKVEALARKGKNYPEKDAANIIQQVLQAVTYCHNKKLVHRDIKLENIMLQSKKKNTDDIKIKLIDFGLSIRYDSKIDEPLTSIVGSPYYVAPEVLNGLYTNSCDVWSIGVSTYALLTGKFPFEGMDEISSDSEVELLADDWDGISDNAKEFVMSLLQKDPSLRPSASEAAQHEWFQVIKDSDCDQMDNNQVTGSLFGKIKKSFNIKGKIHPDS